MGRIVCILIFTGTMFFSFNFLVAQNNQVASGGDASGSNGSASYSVGQIVYQKIFSETGSVAEGIQHPYDLTVTTGLEETGIDLDFAIYPNPTFDVLILKYKGFEGQSLDYKLYDIHGKLHKNEKITEHTTLIEMTHLAATSYLLVVSNGDHSIKSYKIIKTN